MNIEIIKQARAELQKHFDETFDAMASIDRLLTTLGTPTEFGDLDLKSPKLEVRIVNQFTEPVKPEPATGKLSAFLARKPVEPVEAPTLTPPAPPEAPAVLLPSRGHSLDNKAQGMGLVATIEMVLPYMVEPFSAINLRSACRAANPSLSQDGIGNLNQWINRAVEKGRLSWDDDAKGYRKNGQPKPEVSAGTNEAPPAPPPVQRHHNGDSKPVRDLNSIARERIATLEVELDSIVNELEDMKIGPVRDTWQEKAEAIMAEIKKNELLLA